MKKMICIVCPVGCHLTVDDNHVVKGHRCARGEAYGIKEVTHPTRLLTTTVRTTSPRVPRLSVKTREPIPKGLLFDAMRVIGRVNIDHDVKVGDVIIKDLLDTGVDIIATKPLDLRYNKRKDVRR